MARRPSYLPAQVTVKIDPTAVAVRLVAVDKTAIPAGSTINPATGVISVPLGVAVTTIAGVTRNAAAFANAGQFALSGSNLLIDPAAIVQPAVGVVDTYVVTVTNLGGGSTLVTVKVSHGSVKIDSIVVATVAVDTVPNAFSFVDQTGVALSTVIASAAITVSGINTASPISVTGGEYRINAGAWTTTAGTVNNGDTVQARHTSSAANSTATNTTVTIGGVSDTFTSTTLGNTAPSFSVAPSNQSTGKNTNAVATLTVADAETAAASLTVTAVSSNQSIATDANVVVTAGAGGSRTITVTPVAGATGTATITVTVSDGTTSVNSTFTVTFTNAAPVFGSTQGALTLTQNAVMSNVTLPVATDADTGETLTYSIVSGLPAGLTFTPATRVLSGTPTTLQGATAVTYRVTDASGVQTDQTFNITVSAPPNTAPSVSNTCGPDCGI